MIFLDKNIVEENYIYITKVLSKCTSVEQKNLAWLINRECLEFYNKDSLKNFYLLICTSKFFIIKYILIQVRNTID